MLRGKLARLEEERRDAEINAKYQAASENRFRFADSQLLSAPRPADQRPRTGYGQSHFQNVLDGDIQGFLDATLRWKASGKPAASEE